MKNVYIAVACLALLACSGSPPVDIGFNNNRLLQCPDKPNCVSSYESKDDETHYIAPLTLEDLSTAKTQIIQLIDKNDSAKIVKSSDSYIYAEYTSSLMKFVDDVEFYIDKGQRVVQVRSASRLGYSDLGANRNRIEAIREQLK